MKISIFFCFNNFPSMISYKIGYLKQYQYEEENFSSLFISLYLLGKKYKNIEFIGLE